MRRCRRGRLWCAWWLLAGLSYRLPGQVNNQQTPCGDPQYNRNHTVFEIPYFEENHPCSLGETHHTFWVPPYQTGPNIEVWLVIWDPCDGVMYAQKFKNFAEAGEFVNAMCNWDIEINPLPTPSARVSAQPAGATVGFQASQSFVLDDLNGDGTPDVAFPNATGITVQLLKADQSVLKTVNLSLPFNARDPSNSRMIAADFNGDGKLDLAVSNGGSYGSDSGGVAILLGNGDGTFQAPQIFPAGGNPLGLAAADFNGDGKLDLATFNQYAPQFSILTGNGDGTFGAPANYPTGSQGYPESILALDLNKDGRPDLAIANAGPNSISVVLNTASGLGAPSTIPLAVSPAYLAAIDLNHDGALDLTVASVLSNGIAVLLGRGNGTFQAPAYYATGNGPGSIGLASFADGSTVLTTIDGNTGVLWVTEVSPTGDVGAPLMNFAVGGGQAIAAADLNGDGQPDAVIAGGSSDIVVSLANPNGGFSAPVGYSANGASQAVTIGDLNNDGKPDVIAAGGSTVSTLLGNGDGTFKAAVSTAVNAVTQGPQTIALADFNHDGKMDAAVAQSGNVAVLLGNGDGTFRPQAPLSVGSLSALSVASGDLNGDGIPDLAVLAAAPVSSSGKYSIATLYVFLGKGDGTFQSATLFPLQIFGGQQGGIVIGDWNRDGRPDVAAVSNGVGNTVQWQVDVLLGDGKGNFHETAVLPTTEEDLPVGIAAADVNGDGIADLVITHCCGALDVTYLTGKGDGSFSNEQQFLSGASPNATAVTAFGGNIGFLFADAPASGQGPGGMVALAVAPQPPPATAPAIASIVSAASGAIASVAPSSIATIYGSNLAGSTGDSSAAPTMSLAGATVTLTDASGAQQTALLFYVSPAQINFLVPAGTALGTAQVAVASGTGQASASVAVANLAPGLFELNASGLAAAVVLIVHPDNSVTYANVYQLDSSNNIIALPIDLSSGQVYLELYGTGIRKAQKVTVQVGGKSVPAPSSGAQGQYQGLDQVNVGPLPPSLAGAGQTNIVLTADGQTANTVNVTFR